MDGYQGEDANEFEVRVSIKAGQHAVGVTFLNQPAIEYVKEGFRQRFEKPFSYDASVMPVYAPFVQKVTITGPFDSAGPGDTPSRRAIFVCRPTRPQFETGCAETILSTLVRRAYRRPVTTADLSGLVKFFEQGRRTEGFEGGVEVALRALLVSPEFLFRAEADPPHIEPEANFRITDLELASRLSFFLWSSIPDDTLLNLARHGKLRDPSVLDKQVRRMLADERSKALVTNLVGQWLQLRNLEAARPSSALFPDFDESLRQSLLRETELFFDSILRENRSAMELLTADYTFLNERLGRHYGVPNISGSHFRRVTLSDPNRRGLLGQGSILLVTSHAIRTSPVLRGKWILANILGTPPPPPPPNVPALEERKIGGTAVAMSVRERMAAHRRNPVCANCHAMIDPAGFALENFDAIGRWRTVDESFNPIDASGTLPDGTKFSGPVEFREALTKHPERFVRTVTERLLTYALGRGMEYYDMPAVRRIERMAAVDDYRLSTLIAGVVASQPFQMRRSAPVRSERATR
jgi:hypothetical protein